jgi:hypothetical protein
MYNKKSQAALEFLTTYAWAFLVILIMVGALVYFGIGSPIDLLPERCSLGAEFECRDFKMTHGTGVNLILVNKVGEAIKITKIETASEGATSLVCETSETVDLGTGGSDTFTVDGEHCAASDWTSAGFTGGEKGKIDIIITYYKTRSSSTFEHEIKGDIFGTIQEAGEEGAEAGE